MWWYRCWTREQEKVCSIPLRVSVFNCVSYSPPGVGKCILERSSVSDVTVWCMSAKPVYVCVCLCQSWHHRPVTVWLSCPGAYSWTTFKPLNICLILLWVCFPVILSPYFDRIATQSFCCSVACLQYSNVTRLQRFYMSLRSELLETHWHAPWQHRFMFGEK